MDTSIKNKNKTTRFSFDIKPGMSNDHLASGRGNIDSKESFLDIVMDLERKGWLFLSCLERKTPIKVVEKGEVSSTVLTLRL
jgi:hypothetical protein